MNVSNFGHFDFNTPSVLNPHEAINKHKEQLCDHPKEPDQHDLGSNDEVENPLINNIVPILLVGGISLYAINKYLY